MLGNDIVDLNAAKIQSNWKRNGYLAKIFSAEEQAQILTSNVPDQLVWLLWSMKEATYKIVNREGSKRFYSPNKFYCSLKGTNGIVSFEGQNYYTKSVVNERLIHTIASIEQENLMLIKTCYAENKPDYLMDFNTKSSSYFIEKNAAGIPSLVHKKNGTKYEASISHHGKYLAICFPHFRFTKSFPSLKTFQLS